MIDSCGRSLTRHAAAGRVRLAANADPRCMLRKLLLRKPQM
jgi:hypothetical protein